MLVSYHFLEQTTEEYREFIDWFDGYDLHGVHVTPTVLDTKETIEQLRKQRVRQP